MNKYCIGILIILCVYLWFNKDLIEGNNGGSGDGGSGDGGGNTVTQMLAEKERMRQMLAESERMKQMLIESERMKQMLVESERMKIKLMGDKEYERQQHEKKKRKGKKSHAKPYDISPEDAFARHNFKMCKDGGGYHSCKINYRKPPSIYINPPPPTKLNPSNMYNKLSICPEAYQTNIDLLYKKKSLGQYSGYSDNAYIDRTRYIHPKKGKEPLPVNPDFFMKGGGQFA
jgi:hypothetical protein